MPLLEVKWMGSHRTLETPIQQALMDLKQADISSVPGDNNASFTSQRYL